MATSLPDQDDRVPSDGPSDGDPSGHGAGDAAGSAGDPLPEEQQWWRRDRGLPLQPAGPATVCAV